ncbi:MAG: phage tail length tape measure family protein [Ethanoligenens sp.]
MFALGNQITRNEKYFSEYTAKLKTVESQENSNGSSLSKLKSSFAALGEKAQSSGSGIKKTFSDLKGVIGGFTAGVLASLSVNTIVTAVDLAEKTTAQMSAVLKSTGGVAGVTAKQLGDLATAQAKVTTFSGSTTKQAENMLLTFTNIKGSVFPQTIKAAEDMATAMGTSATDAAKTLGKAMNDPAEGLSKLTKQGVTFTDAQQKQIKAMQESGDVAGAQTLILQELEKEFGGSAAAAGSTMTGQIQIMKNNMSDAGVQVAQSLMPIAQTILPMIIQVAQNVAAFITSHKAQIQGDVKEVTDVIKNVFTFITTHGPLIEGIIVGLGSAFAGLKIATIIGGVIVKINAAKKAIEDVGGAAKGANIFAKMFGFSPQILLIIAAIALLAFGIYELVTHWKQVTTAVQAFGEGALGVLNVVKNAIVGLFGGIGAWFAGVFTGAVNGIKTAFGAVIGFFAGIGGGIKDGVSDTVNGIKSVFSSIAGFFSNIGDAIKNAITGAFNFISDFFHAFVEGWDNGFVAMQTAPESVAAAIAEVFNDVFTFFKNIFTSIGNAASAPFKKIIDAVQQIATGVRQVFGGFATLLKDLLVGPFLLLFDVLGGLFTGNWGRLGQDATKLLAQMSGAIHVILQGIYNIFVGIFNAIREAVITIFTAIAATPGAVLNAMVIFVRTILIAFRDEVSAIWNAMLLASTTVWNALTAAAQATFNGLVIFIQTIIDSIVSAWNIVVSFFWSLPGNIENAMSAIGNGIRNVWDGIVEFFSNLPDTIGNIMNTIGSWVRSVWDGLVGFVASIPGRFMFSLSSLGGAVRSGFQDAISFITGLPSEALKWGSDIIDGIVNGIKNAAGAVGKAVQGVAQDIRSFLHFSKPDTGPLADFDTYMPDMMSTMAQGITANSGKLRAAAASAASALSGSLQSNAIPAIAAAHRKSVVQSIDNSVTKAPVININGPVNVQSKGSQSSTLQQLQFLSDLS